MHGGVVSQPPNAADKINEPSTYCEPADLETKSTMVKPLKRSFHNVPNDSGVEKSPRG